MFFFGWPPFPLLGLFTYLLNVTSYCNAWLLVCQDSAPKSSHWLVNSLKCHLTFSFSWSLLTLLKLFLLFESSILNFQPKHRKGASIASAPSSLRGRKRETQKPGDCTLRLEKKPWTILKILPRQNLQCREMEGLQATATPHSFVQSRQTLREDFLLSQPANDEHGLKVVEKGGDDSWGSFKMLGQANVPFFFVELHWQLGLAPKQRVSQSPPNGSGMPTLLDQVAQRFNLGRLQETRNGWIITSILLCRLPSGNRRKPICRYIFLFGTGRFPIAAFKDSRSSNVSTGEIPKEICQWHSEAW